MSKSYKVQQLGALIDDFFLVSEVGNDFLMGRRE